MERITKRRALILLLIIVLIMSFFAGKIYSVQILGTGNVVDNSSVSTSLIRVRAARGDILDTDGNILVGNRASYNMVFNNYVVLNSDDPNGNILKLIELCQNLEIEYEEHFPVTLTKPYQYTLDEYDSNWKDYFQSYLTNMDIDSDISAPRLMETLRSRYKIPDDWTDAQARRVIGIRYELALRTVVGSLASYEFIVDVEDSDMTAILELNTPGLTPEVSTVREYYTQYAAHILGTVGKISAEEWPEYQEKGYSMDAYIGTSGLEEVFEEQLHGTDGLLKRTVDKEGNIVSEYYVTEPVAGNNVEISIDLAMQAAAEETMAEVFQSLIDAGDKGSDVQGGAVVAMEVKTGKVLVCGSYPTYDLSTYSQDFNTLKEDSAAPLLNRALLAAYPPGSTYKMSMTVAGIDSGTITRYTPITTKGIYTKYASSNITPTCMAYTSHGTTHGTIDVTGALKVSCNYFFYTLGDMLDIETMDATAKALGLGEPTGIELAEATGRRANPETKQELYGNSNGAWYAGNQILAAIGQDENRFTPIQMASYVTALANQGTRYKATFLNRVVSSDYSTLVEESVPTVLSTYNMSDEAYQAVHDGMLMVTQESGGTAYGYFSTWDMDIAVCGKTGTAEHGSGGSNNGAFVCYAPADDPQIAIAVYGEKTSTGGILSKVAMAIMDIYFDDTAESSVIAYENQIG